MPGWLSWTRRLRPKAIGMSPEVEKALRGLGVRHYDEDLLVQNHEWLRQQFPRDSKRIMKESFFLNVVWQTYEKIQASTTPEERPDFYNKKGVIRSMWYYLKPRIDHMPEFIGDQADRVGEALKKLVEAGVLSYTDFNLVDKNKGDRCLGVDNPYVMLIAEKDGFLTMMLDFQATYGCHVFTLGGSPPFISTNYFVAELVEAKVDITREFVCISIVDFDPKGTIIMRSFADQLRKSGLKKLKTFKQYAGRPKPDPYLDLIRPENLPRDVRYRDVQYNLPKSEQKRWWGRETGGPNGRGDYKHGIESDEFREARIREMIEEAIAPHLTTGAEVVQKRVSFRNVAQALEGFAAWKMIHGGSAQPGTS
ncbi:MAG: hypothetical protein AB1646_23345 [Thermodesulfobacteriota bacterium]